MIIIEPCTSIVSAFDSAKTKPEQTLRSLADGNSRYTYFEAIRDVTCPTELRHSSGSKQLTGADYLMEAPIQNRYYLAQMRLNTLKMQIESAAIAQAKARVDDEKKAEFARGLLGF